LKLPKKMHTIKPTLFGRPRPKKQQQPKKKYTQVNQQVSSSTSTSSSQSTTSTPSIQATQGISPISWSHLFLEARAQGTCGGCWAFATTGIIEGYYALKKPKL